MKKTRRLVMLALALVLTFAMATTTTFAWFTMNTIVKVKGISGKATTDTEGLLVSTSTGENWAITADFGATVANLDALTMGKSIVPETKVVTPSAVDDVLGTGVKFFDKAGADVTTGGKYLQKDIFFNANEAMAITLSKISLKVTSATGRLIKTPLGFDEDTFGDHDAITDEAEMVTSMINALRLAVFGADGKLIAVYAFQAGDTDAFWDNEATAAPYAGLNLAGALYYQIMGAAPTVSGDGLVTATPTLTLNETNQYYDAAPAQVIGNLAGGNAETKCTIVIWVEGLDGHCLNNIIDQEVDVILEFTGGTVGP